jgi:sialate O-acetylesterase
MSGAYRVLAVAALLIAAPASARLLDNAFGDHAVLQRGKPIRVWGRATAGESVTVSLGSRRTTARADAAGRWATTLPAQAAGGPYELDVRAGSGAQEKVVDILIGDVFLCSGQSNMEFPLSKSLGASAAIAASDDPLMRLATIPQVSAPLPLSQFHSPLVWAPASPASTPNFSAVCWYMAKALRRDIKAPIGLLDASWGGSTIQAWLSPAALTQGGGDQAAIDLLAMYNRDAPAANLAWGKTWEAWWHDTVSTSEKPWTSTSTAGWLQVPSMDLWEKWSKPVLSDFNGMIWYQTHVMLTPAQARLAATLDVGAIDEIDQTWVNGHPVGTGANDEARAYPIPAGMLVPGENVINVNILDTWETGGPFGPGERRALTLSDGTRLPLEGPWFYRKVDHNRPRPPRAPWYPAWGQGTLYNGMIAPLGSYGLRSMAWYQGESNPTDGLGYGKRLEALYRDRRTTFGENLPILLVQLANYGPVNERPVESEWAAVREAQRRQAVRDPYSGLAVTIDVGNPTDIHPLDKRAVGERLSRAALAVVYGRNVPRVGAQPTRAIRTSAGIEISFQHAGGRLAVNGLAGPFELCRATTGSCLNVKARLIEDTIVLPASPVATRVRYCWGDSPRCGVSDAGGPLTPFEIIISATAG